MWKALSWTHAKLYRVCLWLLGLPFRAIWTFFLAVLMLLGEEVRRWIGLIVSGVMIVLAGKATLAYAPPSIGQPLAIAVLLLFVIWAFAVKRAAHYTMRNNLLRVRQRMWFREVAGNVRNLRTEITGRMARATEGTAVGGAFRTNREKTERARQAAAERTAEQERHRQELAKEPDPAIWEWI